MKSKLLKILTEIGISIVILVAVSAIVVIILYNKIPYGKIVPEPINYQNIDQQEYTVRGDVEELKNATATYESNLKDLQHYEVEGQVDLGRTNPFSIIESENSDLPTEKIGNAGSNENTENVGNTEDTTPQINNPSGEGSTVPDINEGGQERTLESE